MERTIISFDYAIKNILRDKANFDILSGFLTELLGRQVSVQDILESEGNTESQELKVNRLDLKAKIDSGELVVFEIQFFDQIDFFGKVLFNACKAVVEQVSSGKQYDIKKVYSVNIAYFDMGSKNEYVFFAGVSAFSGIHFDEIIPFSQNLNPPLPANSIHPEYYLILPNKFDEQMRSRFDEWVYVLKNSAVKNEFTAAGIQAAGEKLNILKMTPEERTDYERMKTISFTQKNYFYTAELKGRLQGEAIGIEKGEAKEKEAAVIRGHHAGFSVENIALITGLPQQQIIEILNNYEL